MTVLMDLMRLDFAQYDGDIELICLFIAFSLDFLSTSLLVFLVCDMDVLSTISLHGIL